jgi:uncharacterized membrane-anchored protein
MKEVLLKHKDFITMVAKDLINPAKGNDNIVEILSSYNEIDTTVEMLTECSTCQNIYTTPFKIILAYCESNSWFEPTIKNNKK